MSAHDLYVTAAYAISAVGVLGLIGWILFEQRLRRRQMAELEEKGIRRRSDASAAGE